jgi:hypothetical protein
MSTKLLAHGRSSAITLPPDLATPSVDQQIADFIDGRSDGAALMLALYGEIADEPLPPRFAQLLNGWRSR